MKNELWEYYWLQFVPSDLLDVGNTNNSDTSAKKEDTTKASYIVRIGMPTAGKHFQNFTAEQYKETIEKATNGDIIVEIYPSSQLGTATQMIQGVQDGSIEGVRFHHLIFVPLRRHPQLQIFHFSLKVVSKFMIF